jgi:hypothetical protein
MGEVFAPLQSFLAEAHGFDEAGFFLEMARQNLPHQFFSIAALPGCGMRQLRFEFGWKMHFHGFGSSFQGTLFETRRETRLSASLARYLDSYPGKRMAYPAGSDLAAKRWDGVTEKVKKNTGKPCLRRCRIE